MYRDSASEIGMAHSQVIFFVANSRVVFRSGHCDGAVKYRCSIVSDILYMLTNVSNTTRGRQNHLSFMTKKAALVRMLAKSSILLSQAPASSTRTANSRPFCISGASESVTVLYAVSPGPGESRQLRMSTERSCRSSQ